MYTKYVKNIFTIIILAFFNSGCTTHYMVGKGESSISFEEAKQRIENRSGKLTTQNGNSFEVKYIELQKDSVYWLDPTNSHRKTLATTEVTKYKIKNPGRGAGDGALVGIFSGLIIGGAVGYAAGEDCGSDSWLCFNRDGTAALGAIGGGVLGLFIGVITGASIGSSENYHFQHPLPVLQATKIGRPTKPKKIRRYNEKKPPIGNSID